MLSKTVNTFRMMNENKFYFENVTLSNIKKLA